MAKKAMDASDSSLSPAPENLTAPVEAEVTVKIAPNGRKRKAEATVKTTAETTKRSKTASANGVKDEVEAAEADETPRKKRATTKKVKYEEENADDKATAIIEKTVKKKVTRTKKSKEPEPPLEARTVDTKLRIGAHVSVAGG